MQISVAQYAAKSGISKADVYALCRAGFLPAEKNEMNEWVINVPDGGELPTPGNYKRQPVVERPAAYPPGLIEALVDRIAARNGNRQAGQTPIIYVQGPPSNGGINEALVKIIEVFGPPLVESLLNRQTEKENPIENIKALAELIQSNVAKQEPTEDKATVFFQYVMPYLPALIESIQNLNNAKTENKIPEPGGFEEPEEFCEDIESGRRYAPQFAEGITSAGQDYDARLAAAFPGRPEDPEEGIDTPSDGNIGNGGGGL